jgi:hypothetical protein
MRSYQDRYYNDQCPSKERETPDTEETEEEGYERTVRAWSYADRSQEGKARWQPQKQAKLGKDSCLHPLENERCCHKHADATLPAPTSVREVNLLL